MSTSPAVPVASAAALDVSIDDVRPSATNPRKHFDEGALAELAESIRAKGIIQPLLVRRIPPDDADRLQAFEVVAGERRYRAAKIAEQKTIPVVVRDLTDTEALELQLIENLHRNDLHPLEEAEGYEHLQKLNGYSVEELAVKVLKSKAYVYARLKLLALGPLARKALDAAQLQRLLVDLALVRDTYVSAWGGERPDRLMATAKRYKVDVEKIRREVLAEARAKETKGKAKPKRQPKKAARA